jgi:hypothetical protein
VLKEDKLTENDVAILSGLYTFAVEEYGKLLILTDLKVVGGEVTVPYRNRIRNHSGIESGIIVPSSLLRLKGSLRFARGLNLLSRKRQ